MVSYLMMVVAGMERHTPTLLRLTDGFIYNTTYLSAPLCVRPASGRFFRVHSGNHSGVDGLRFVGCFRRGGRLIDRLLAVDYWLRSEWLGG